jgi:hypothetical protein
MLMGLKHFNFHFHFTCNCGSQSNFSTNGAFFRGSFSTGILKQKLLLTNSFCAFRPTEHLVAAIIQAYPLPSGGAAVAISAAAAAANITPSILASKTGN